MSIRLQDIERVHVGLVAVAVVLAVATGWISAWGVVLGGFVMGANFWLMRQLSQRMLTPRRVQQPALLLALLTAKLSVFLGLLAVLFWRVRIDPAGFGVGATMLLVACVFVAIRPRSHAAA